jgi:CheY-like chemotaxis protein
LGRLFNAFEQGEPVDRRHRTGLGLGLSITRNLIEAHRGTISGSSAGESHGSTFTVELPALEAQPVPPAPAAPVPAVTTAKLRLLLVEDHAATQVVLRKILLNLGHEVTTASNVAEAVTLGSTGQHDVLLSDLGLPDGTGMDLMRILGTRFHGRAIALSGYGADTDIQASQAAGFTLHLIKPVEIDAVIAALHTLARIVAHQSPPPPTVAPLFFPPEASETCRLPQPAVPVARP